MLRDITTFVQAVLKFWVWFVTSSAVAAGMWLLSGGVTMIPPWIIWAVAAFGFVVAGFLAWRNEKTAKEALALECRALREGVEKERDAILAKAVPFATGRNKCPLQALSYADGQTLRSQDDLDWVCAEMVRFCGCLDPFARVSDFVAREDRLLFLKEYGLRAVGYVGEDEKLLSTLRASWAATARQ